jgi:hypothetical protein
MLLDFDRELTRITSYSILTVDTLKVFVLPFIEKLEVSTVLAPKFLEQGMRSPIINSY